MPLPPRLVAALLCLTIPVPLSAQNGTLALASYRRARQVLDQALVAHGGVTALRAIQTISVRHEGTFFNRNQSRRVAPPYDPTPSNGYLAVDYRENRLVWEQETGFPGGFRNLSRLVITPKAAWQLTPLERRWFTVTNAAASQRGLLRRLPHTYLLTALERANTLRWLGEVTWQGRKQAVISFAEDGQFATLFVDRKAGTLTKVESLFEDPLTGDALAEIIFTNYVTVGAIRLPSRRLLRRAGETVEAVNYLDMAVDGPFPDSLQIKPADWVDGSSTPPSDTTVASLADGVYLAQGVGGTNNTLIVEFRDYLVAIEPYGNDADSRRVIATIKGKFPGKSIRYIVPTHHHDDHTGGLRTYIAEGITVLTTPGNREYVTRMSRGRWTLAPDLQAERQTPAKIEITTGTRTVLSDGEQVLELLNIGPSPHADEMLVAWLPRQHILFQGDLLNRPADGRPRAGNLTTRHFAEWLRGSGLPVERIAAVHGPVGTLADLDTALALMAAE